MNINYYQEQDFRFTEIATALEKFSYTSKAKFFLNTITPLLSSGSPIDETRSKGSTKNILNYTSILNISNGKASNYVELNVPRYIGEALRDGDGYISKGTQFIVTFVGGDINKPRIVGVY